jgi:hypothetical protein
MNLAIELSAKSILNKISDYAYRHAISYLTASRFPPWVSRKKGNYYSVAESFAGDIEITSTAFTIEHSVAVRTLQGPQ